MKLKKIGQISSLDILEQTHLDKLYNRQSNVKRFFIDINTFIYINHIF